MGSLQKRREKTLIEIEKEIDAMQRKVALLTQKAESYSSAKHEAIKQGVIIQERISELENLKRTL